MCYLCDTRGEGMIWYKNPKNYARRMYKRRKHFEKPMEVARGIEREVTESEWETLLMEAINSKCNGDLVDYENRIREIDDNYKQAEGIQVLPLKECFEIVDIATPLAAMSCMCRRYTRGIEEDEKTFSCLGVGPGMFKWERWQERYRGGAVFMSPDEAKKWLTYWDKRGMVHILMTYRGQMGGICNCDYPVCMPIRHRLDYGIEHAVTKAEYVISIDDDLCNGCGNCIKRCQFGAIRLDVTRRKANIDQMRCFGCGLCENGCPQSALSLIDRKSSPILREVW